MFLVWWFDEAYQIYTNKNYLLVALYQSKSHTQIQFVVLMSLPDCRLWRQTTWKWKEKLKLLKIKIHKKYFCDRNSFVKKSFVFRNRSSNHVRNPSSKNGNRSYFFSNRSLHWDRRPFYKKDNIYRWVYCA